jgi:hypothetical protein
LDSLFFPIRSSVIDHYKSIAAETVYFLRGKTGAQNHNGGQIRIARTYRTGGYRKK